MKISCVILNYNDAQTTIRQILRIRAFACFQYIIVVDNASSDDSLELLSQYQDEKVQLLSANKNGGYGSGNNLGVTYSLKSLGMTHVVIANPDAVFSERSIRRTALLFGRDEKLAAAAPVMTDATMGKQASVWPLSGWLLDLFNTGPVCRRIFKRYLRYPASYFSGKKAVYAEVLHGSLLMVDAAKMMACGGYDERIFLYNEEAVLAFRLKKWGWRSAQLLTDHYYHDHSTSISKTFQSVIDRQRLRHQSAVFYYQNYLKIGKGKLALTRAFHQIILWEIWVCSRMLKMKW